MSSNPEVDRIMQPIFDRLRCGLLDTMLQIEEFRAAVESFIADEDPLNRARDRAPDPGPGRDETTEGNGA